MPITLTDDSAAFDALAKRLGELDGLSGLAGLFDGKLARRGARHEGVLSASGAARAEPDEDQTRPPIRPWLSASTDQLTPRLQSLADTKMGDVVDGNTDPESAMGELADTVADAAVAYVEGGRVGGKALSRQAKRNDTRKLIDSGDMIDAVTTDVVPSREVPRD